MKSAKRMIVCLMFLFMVMLVVFAAPQRNTQQTQQKQYVVKAGDNLWNIAKRNPDSTLAWQTIVDLNKYLQDPGRRYIDKKGRIIIVIHKGEILQGVNEKGIVDTPAVRIIEKNQPVAYPTTTPVDYSWLWWLLGLLLLFVVILVGRFFYKKNPTEWRPVIQNGVNNPEEVYRVYTDLHHASPIPGSQTKVRLSGLWRTRHSGIMTMVPHRLNQQRAWRSMFQMPNGTQEQGYMLQACGNDVRMGAWYAPLAGAIVTEGWGDEVASTTVPQSTTSSVADPVKVAQPAEQIEHFDSIRFEMRHADEEQPAMFRLSGIDEKGDNTFEVKPGMIVVRYTPRS